MPRTPIGPHSIRKSIYKHITVVLKHPTALNDTIYPIHDIESQPHNKRDLIMPLGSPMTLPALMLTLPLSPRPRRVNLPLIQHVVHNRSFMLPMRTMMGVGPELFFVGMAARRAVAFLDSLFDIAPMVVTFGVVVALAVVLLAAAGGVAGILAFGEVAFGAVMVASFAVISALAVVLFASTGRVARFLAFREFAFRVVIVASFAVISALAVVLFATTGRVAGLLAFNEVAFGVRTSRVVRMLFYVVFTVAPTGRVARFLSGDQGSGFALVDRLR